MTMDEPRSSDQWHLRTLGGWGVTRAGVEVVLPPRDQRLVALLLIDGRRPRSVLAARLWPDATDVRASSNLRSATLDLRRRAPGLVQSVAGTICLDPAVRSDLTQLRRLLRGGHTMSLIEEAGALLRVEDLLPGWYQEWVVSEREYLHEGTLDRIQHVVRGLVDIEAADQALPLVRVAIQLDPMRESAHRALARLHLLSGDRVAAWQVYAGFRQRSVREFGVSPSSRFEELIEPLRAERRARKAVGRTESLPGGVGHLAAGVRRRPTRPA